MGEAGRDWFPLSGCQSGRLRLSAEWKPVAMAGSLHGLDHYKFPIGVVRLHLIKATDVKYAFYALVYGTEIDTLRLGTLRLPLVAR